MKKIFQVLLSLVMIMSTLTFNVKARDVEIETVSVTNDNGTMIVEKVETKNISTYAINRSSIEDFLTFEEAGKELAKAMINREEKVTIKYKTVEKPSSWYKDLFNEAIKHDSNNPKAGDSILFQYGGYSCSCYPYTFDGSDGYYYGYEVNFTIKYYTTLNQEKLVDAKVDELIDELQLRQGNKYERLNRIYDYLTANVTYNYDYDINVDTSPWSAYGSLVLNYCVCQGYTLGMYRLCLEAGIDCRIISGLGKSGSHAWNIVALDDKEGNINYYNCDATWDAVRSKYTYFLKGSSDFPSHTSDSQYTSDEFLAEYPIAECEFFNNKIDVNEDFKYVITGNDAIILDYLGDASDVIIPSQIEGYDVISVESLENKSFNTITYEEGIIYIGDLLKCDNLTHVTYPSTFIYDEQNTFAQSCSNLESYEVNEGGKIKVVDGVLYSNDEKEILGYPCNKEGSTYSLLSRTNTIHKYAFYGSENLSSLTFNPIDTIVCDEAFYGSSIETFNNFEYVIELGSKALRGSHIKELNIGKKIKLGTSCIYGTYRLEKINIASDNLNTFVYNQLLYQRKADGIHLIGGVINNTTDLYIHYDCEYIDNYALYGTKATNVYLSENIKYVGDFAFMDGNMKNVNFGKNTTHFGVQALSYCWYLKQVTIMADNPVSAGSLFYSTNQNATIYTDSSNVINQANGYNVLSLSETVYVDELKSLINYAQELDENRYSESQLTLIQAAIDEAMAVLLEPTNETVEAIHTKLYDLVFNSNSSKAKVNEIINDLSKYQAVLKENYTKASLAKYEEALNNIVNSKDDELTISEENDLINAFIMAQTNLDDIEIYLNRRVSQTGYVYAGLSDGAYRYLADEVLSVKLQLSTNDKTNETSLRIVSSVDSLDFDEVGFDLRIEVDGVYSNTLTKSTTSVYESIKSNTDGNVIVNNPSVFSKISKYMFALRINNIPSSNYDSKIEIKPYWITNDGKKVYGVTRVVTINELLNR